MAVMGDGQGRLNRLKREFCHRHKPKDVSDDFQNRVGFANINSKQELILDPDYIDDDEDEK